MVRPSRLAASILAFASLLHEAPAVADTGRGDVQFTWHAPEGCPSVETVVSDVKRVLTESGTRGAVVRADVTKLAEGRWGVHIVTTVDGMQGERSFEAESCPALATATALIIAWTVDSVRASAPPPAPPPPTPPPLPPPPAAPSSPTVAPPQEPPHAPPPRTRRVGTPVSPFVATSGQADLGTFPGAALALDIALGLTVGPVRLEAWGDPWLEQDATSQRGDAHLHLVEAGGRGCYRSILRRGLELDPCLGGGGAYLWSVGFNETNDAHSHGVWPFGRGDVLFSWRLLGPVALRATVGATVPLARPPVVIEVPQASSFQLHRPSAVAGRATIGLEAHFP